MSNFEMYTSLADLAAMNTDGIAALRSRLPAAGLYLVTMTEAGLSEIETDETDPSKRRAAVTYKGVIDFFAPPAEKEDMTQDQIDSMIGKQYTQRVTLWLSDLPLAIGLLKGQHQTAHLRTNGAPGGLEGVEPGWLDHVIGKRVGIRVRHVARGDDTRAYYDWLSAKALAKLGISWDEMGRAAEDKDGNPIEVEG